MLLTDHSHRSRLYFCVKERGVCRHLTLVKPSKLLLHIQQRHIPGVGQGNLPNKHIHAIVLPVNRVCRAFSLTVANTHTPKHTRLDLFLKKATIDLTEGGWGGG